MTITILILAFTLVIVAIGLVAILATGSDLLRRRRGDRDATVIADSEVEFEADVGKPPPGS